MLLLLASLLFVIGCPLYLKSKLEDVNDVVSACTSTYEKVYLAIGETTSIDGTIENNNDDIVMVVDNVAIGKKKGITTLQVSNCPLEIEVTDLYSKQTINNNKPYLPCGRYNKEENDYLDKALQRFINKAGYKTRAGVVEAARFLTLRFNYKMNYFYENGRLTNDGIEKNIVDGEGRYYHTGLYLSDDRINDVKPTLNGPATWGCELFENYDEEYIPNSLDCSSFICWAMLNAGFDVGDLGAGPIDDVDDLTDIGKLVSIEDVNVSDIKVGDLIGFDGHIGIFIGDDGSNLYVAHMYWESDLQVSTYSYSQIKNTDWEYVILMDSFYQYDGNITNYWG